MRGSAQVLVVAAAVSVLILALRASPGQSQQQQQLQAALARRVATLEELTESRRRDLRNWQDEAAALRTLAEQNAARAEELAKEVKEARRAAAAAASAAAASSASSSAAGGNGASADDASAASVAPANPNRKPGERPDPVVAGITCPGQGAVDPNATGGQIPLEHLPRGKPTTVAQKYDRRWTNCFKHGLWSSVSLEDHRKIMDVIGRLIHIRPRMTLLDWGCGCGHKLQWFHNSHNTSGLGVDVSAKSLQYAQAETSLANAFCHADGSNMYFIPSNTFDAAFSFGSVFHLYNETLICRAYKEMIRVVKPGGWVYNGWTAEDEFTNPALFRCLRDEKETVASVEVLRELGGPAAIFTGIKTFPTKLKGYGLGNEINRKRMPSAAWRKLKPPSYTHLIHKAG